MNTKLGEQIKSLDGKNSNCKYQLSTVKNIIKEKNNEINILKEELISVEIFKNDKDRKNNEIKILNNDIINLKEEIEKKTKKIRELEKINTEYKLKSDELFIENQLIKNENHQKAYMELLNEKQKVIRCLDRENSILKIELSKYDKNFECELIKYSTAIDKENNNNINCENDYNDDENKNQEDFKENKNNLNHSENKSCERDEEENNQENNIGMKFNTKIFYK